MSETAAGGWDGIVVTFGEGCTLASLEAIFGPIMEWNVKLTLRNGDEIECQLDGFDRDDDDIEVAYSIVDEDDQPTEKGHVKFADVVNIHIY